MEVLRAVGSYKKQGAIDDQPLLSHASFPYPTYISCKQKKQLASVASNKGIYIKGLKQSIARQEQAHFPQAPGFGMVWLGDHSLSPLLEQRTHKKHGGTKAKNCPCKIARVFRRPEDCDVPLSFSLHTNIFLVHARTANTWREIYRNLLTGMLFGGHEITGDGQNLHLLNNIEWRMAKTLLSLLLCMHSSWSTFTGNESGSK